MLTIEEYINQPIEIKSDLERIFKSEYPKTIFDIGSCTGEDAIKYSNLYPSAQVYAFEPLKSNVEQMEQHFKLFNKTNIKAHNIALSDEDGEATFYLSSGSPFEHAKEDEFTSLIPKDWNKSSSLLPPNKKSEEYLPWLKFDDSVVVKTYRLDSFMDENRITSIDFMHLDVQGAELKVLKGMGSYINNLKVIWLEVENEELYSGQPLKKDIDAFLTKNNFYLVKDTSIGKIAGDCLYVNKNLLGTVSRLLLFLKQIKQRVFI